MPEFYGSQRLFWYLIVATTLNGASLVVLTYFLSDAQVRPVVRLLRADLRGALV